MCEVCVRGVCVLVSVLGLYSLNVVNCLLWSLPSGMKFEVCINVSAIVLAIHCDTLTRCVAKTHVCCVHVHLLLVLCV